MAEKTKGDRGPNLSGSGSASVDALASRALSLVAERNAQIISQLDHTIAQRLHDAAAGLSENTVPDIIDEMKAAGIPPEIIADLYIPHVARQMGDEWCEDSMSFARVTIGTARLQSALRSLGDAWSSYHHANDTSGSRGVIVIVVKDSFHTLGAVVLCGQLRRLGLSVRLSLGASSTELRTIFNTSTFDAALISANESESLDSLREIVEIIRKSASNAPPIIVGGSIVDLDVDLVTSVGADFVTKDPIEALEHCGLTNQKRRTGQQTQRQE